MALVGALCPVCSRSLTERDLLGYGAHASAFCPGCLTVLAVELAFAPEETRATAIRVDIAASGVRRMLERVERAQHDGTLLAEVRELSADRETVRLLRVPPILAVASRAFGSSVRLLEDVSFQLDWEAARRTPSRRPGPLGLDLPRGELPFRWPHEASLWGRPLSAGQRLRDTLFDARTKDGLGRLFVPREEMWPTDAWLTAKTVLPVERFQPPRLACKPPELDAFPPWITTRMMWVQLSLIEPV